MFIFNYDLKIIKKNLYGYLLVNNNNSKISIIFHNRFCSEYNYLIVHYND